MWFDASRLQNRFAVESVLPPSSSRTNQSGTSNTNANNTATIAQFQNFLSSFREHESFIYRDRFRANLLRKEWTLEVEMGHLIGWNEDLAARLRNEPGDVIPLVRSKLCLDRPRSTRSPIRVDEHRRLTRFVARQFEIGLRNLAKIILHPTAGNMEPTERAKREKSVPEIQLQLRSGSRLMQFRELGVSLHYFFCTGNITHCTIK